MAKKRTKKHNPLKGKLLMVKQGLKNIGVFRSVQKQEQGSCEVINYKSGNRVDMGQSMARAIIELRHKWTIHIMALGWNGFDHYMKSETIECTNPMFQAELADYLDKEHKAFVKREMNPDHLTDLCWVAIPNGDDLNENELGELLDKLNIWQ